MGDGGSPVPFSDFCVQYPSRACALRFACGRLERPDAPECLAPLQKYCADVDAGRLVYDGVEARACLEELDALPHACLGDLTPCGNLVSYGGSGLAGGSVFAPPPGVCSSQNCLDAGCDLDCAGSTCRPLRQPGESCTRGGRPSLTCDPRIGWCGAVDGGATICHPAARAGESCERTPCAAGLYCDSSAVPRLCRVKLTREAPCTSGEQCEDGVCRNSDRRCGALDAGQPCRGSNECGFSAGPSVCVGLSLFADGGVETAGTCGVRPTLGAPCAHSWTSGVDPCHEERGEGCLDGTCQRLLPFTRPVGSECPLRPWGFASADYLGFAVCQRGLVCLPDPTAHAPRTGRCAPPLGVGAPCRDELWCGEGLLCSRQSDGGSECQPARRRGQPCSYSADCTRDSTCAPVADGGRECAAWLPVGAACSGTITCELSARCDRGSCVPLGATGAACESDAHCLAGACQDGRCVAVCRP